MRGAPEPAAAGGDRRRRGYIRAMSMLHRRSTSAWHPVARRAGVAWLLAVVAAAAAQPVRDTRVEALSLYGLTLKDADAAAFVAAARAAGAVALPVPDGAPPLLDARGAGVPALERLTVIAHEGKLVTARFTVKNYGQDNEALRRALLAKYGVPMTVSARPLPAQGFDGRASPRGAYAWTFAEGMKLVYEHPRVGDTTLSYTDEAKAQALAAGVLPRPGPALPRGELRDRL